MLTITSKRALDMALRGGLSLAAGLTALLAPAAVPTQAQQAAAAVHVVQPGETLWQIALDAGVDSAEVARLNGLENADTLLAGQTLQLPAPGTGSAVRPASAPVATPAPAASAPARPASGSTYQVAAGDTLWSISQQFGVSTETLAKANGLDNPDGLQAGQQLTIPAGGTPAAVVAQPAPTAAPTSAPAVASAAPAAAAQPAVQRRSVTLAYTIQPGETLSSLARQFNMPLDTLVQLNGLDDPNLLAAGAVLKIPVPGREHVVEAGETLRAIAAAEKVDLGALIDFNELADPELIRVGDVLVVPGALPTTVQSSASVPATPTPAAPAPAPPAPTPVPPTPTAARTAAPASPTATRPAATPAAAATPRPASPTPAPTPARNVTLPTDPAGLASVSRAFLGAPYVWGGSGPNVFDCSGFIWYLGQKLAKPLPRSLLAQYNAGAHPARTELKPGDLVFFQNTYTPGLSHNGIYLGNDQFIHAGDERSGVTVSSLNTDYWRGHWFGATRL